MPTRETRSFRCNIRALRLRRGWLQANLSARVGISRQSLSAIENNHQLPGLRLAFDLANVLGVAISEMFVRRVATRR